MIDLQKLRILILLGMEEYNWVNQKVLKNNSEAFLDYVLPKTKSIAAFNLASNIACLEHDKNIQGNRIHLFRLPQSIEMKMNSPEKGQNIQDIILGLSEIASGIAVETRPGAVNIGAISEIQTVEVLQVFAKHYLEAFKEGYKTYPYLS
jgi:hypothetical protein